MRKKPIPLLVSPVKFGEYCPKDMRGSDFFKLLDKVLNDIYNKIQEIKDTLSNNGDNNENNPKAL